MGNCIRRQSSSSSSSSVWAGDDWESVAQHDENGEKEMLLAGGGGGGSLSRSTSSTGRDQVMKIKITKKELEELTRVANLHGLSVERVLSHLANSAASDEEDDHQHRREMLMERQRSWRPALQSIPEVN